MIPLVGILPSKLEPEALADFSFESASASRSGVFSPYRLRPFRPKKGISCLQKLPNRGLDPAGTAPAQRNSGPRFFMGAESPQKGSKASSPSDSRDGTLRLTEAPADVFVESFEVC
jgi:hypothetical protein